MFFRLKQLSHDYRKVLSIMDFNKQITPLKGLAILKYLKPNKGWNHQPQDLEKEKLLLAQETALPSLPFALCYFCSWKSVPLSPNQNLGSSLDFPLALHMKFNSKSCAFYRLPIPIPLTLPQLTFGVWRHTVVLVSQLSPASNRIHSFSPKCFPGDLSKCKYMWVLLSLNGVPSFYYMIKSKFLSTVPQRSELTTSMNSSHIPKYPELHSARCYIC